MSINLFYHNMAAYKSAVSMMDRAGKAAVIHPTGTGKSSGTRLRTSARAAREGRVRPSPRPASKSNPVKREFPAPSRFGIPASESTKPNAEMRRSQ